MGRSVKGVSWAMVSALAVAAAWVSAGPAWAAKAPAKPISPIGNPNAPQGGVITFNIGSEPTTLNPITSTDAYARDVQAFVVEQLANRHEDTYDWVPALAESWEISKDGKLMTFRLREGVKWHDGKPLTVEDVKFSFDVIFDPKFPTAHLRPYYEKIEKAEIVDPRTIRFTTREKYFRNFESVALLTVVPKHVYGDPEVGPKNNKDLIGTGPYRLDKYEKGKRIVLKRSPDWWGGSVETYKGQYNFAEVALRFVKEKTVAIEMLKKGDIDFDEFGPETYMDKAVGPEWGTKVFKVKTQNLAPKTSGFIAWNLTNPLFKDRRVRLALYHLLNRPLMIEKFRYGMALPATGPWYQQSEYASKKVKPVPFDPKRAAALFKEAGWEDSDKDGTLDKEIDGKRVPLRFGLLFANPDVQKYLTLYQEDAKKGGVAIELKQLEWNSFIKLVDERKFEAVNLAWGGGSVDNDPKQIWHSDSIANAGSNFIGYSNPEVDRLIDEARANLDKKSRLPQMRRIYELIAEDVPYAFLFNDKDVLYGHTARIAKPKDSFKYSVGTTYWWAKAE